MLKCAGRFFLRETRHIMKETKTPFNKKYNTPAELVKLLQSRGLLIADTSIAARHIQNIGNFG